MHPNIPGLIRIPIFGVVILFSIIVLGIDGNLVSKLTYSGTVTTFLGSYGYSYTAPAWAKLGVATAVLTFLTLIPMLVIDFFRKGFATSLVAVELGWLGFLWILWLATAADTATSPLVANCDGSLDIYCAQAQAADAFAFLTWIILLVYWVLLLTFAIIAHSNGDQGIWTSTVPDADFSVGGPGPVARAPQQEMVGNAAAPGATYPPTSNV